MQRRICHYLFSGCIDGRIGAFLVGIIACAASAEKLSQPDDVYASTYHYPTVEPLLIRQANVLTAAGQLLVDTDVLIAEGKILEIGQAIVSAARSIDANGKWLTPGIIDVHSHMGVYPSLDTQSLADGNEGVAPNTAQVWAEHGVWPQDPNFEKALAGGVTTVQILPGSANLFGGRGVTLKNVPGVSVQEMKFPDAPHSLKMACGENPKRVYGEKGGPATRMGNVAGYRQAWIAADQYRKKWASYQASKSKKRKKSKADPPERDLQLETLALALEGEILIHNHCYRADEMVTMIDLAKEFGYKISAFHHAIEAYKVADHLAQAGICASVWADWWGFKQEATDMVRVNAALVDYAGACSIIHSDDEIQIQRLSQEVAKVMQAASEIDLEIKPERAIEWITLNPAISIGLDDRIGSIEVGKNADLVLWSGNPFSTYSRAQKVWIDGKLRFDVEQPRLRPTSDFNLGRLPR